MGLVVLVTLGITLATAHTVYETTSSEYECPDWDDQDMRAHHNSMHGDDFDEHHRQMHGTGWEEGLEHCH